MANNARANAIRKTNKQKRPRFLVVLDNVEIAKMAQFSENEFFGKPCGLMDQVACAVGGIVAIDFKDPKAPVIEKMGIDISGHGFNLCIVNTGGNHADLTDDYASVPAEMKSVAKLLGC